MLYKLTDCYIIYNTSLFQYHCNSLSSKTATLLHQRLRRSVMENYEGSASVINSSTARIDNSSQENVAAQIPLLSFLGMIVNSFLNHSHPLPILFLFQSISNSTLSALRLEQNLEVNSVKHCHPLFLSFWSNIVSQQCIHGFSIFFLFSFFLSQCIRIYPMISTH